LRYFATDERYINRKKQKLKGSMLKKSDIMNKNLLLILSVFFAIIFICFVGMMFTVASQTVPRIYVDPPSIGAPVGDNFTIDINVEDVTNLYGFDFKLGYDTSILDATQIEIETWLSGGAECKPFSQIIDGDTCAIIKNVDAGGYVWIVVTLLGEATPASGNGTLATITFQVTGSGESVLDLYDTDLVDSSANKITHNVDDGSFGCRGDIDDDGDVDSYDFYLFSGAYGTDVGDQYYIPDADFDNDGDVDSFDFYIFSGAYGKC